MSFDHKAYNRQRYAEKREHLLAQHAAWRGANPDKQKAATLRWREEHPEQTKAGVALRGKRRWILNPGKLLAKNGKRRAARLQASPGWLTAEHLAQMAALYARARCLTLVTGIRHAVDHIHPLQGKQSCGLHVPWNLQILTFSENSRKSNKENAN